MDEKIQELKNIRDNIDVMIFMLEGCFGLNQLDGNGTISEQISCYENEGGNFTELYKSIVEEYGHEQCPFGR